MRTTEQRKLILEELRKCSHHPAADEIYLHVRERLPRISLGTVYRNLELLAGKGLIRKLEMGSGQRRYDPDIRAHGHFRCTHCGKVEDLPVGIDPPKPEQGHPWVRQRVFHGGDYYGLCPDCLVGSRDQI